MYVCTHIHMYIYTYIWACAMGMATGSAFNNNKTKWKKYKHNGASRIHKNNNKKNSKGNQSELAKSKQNTIYPRCCCCTFPCSSPKLPIRNRILNNLEAIRHRKSSFRSGCNWVWHSFCCCCRCQCCPVVVVWVFVTSCYCLLFLVDTHTLSTHAHAPTQLSVGWETLIVTQIWEK